jgi:hypothetical protein
MKPTDHALAAIKAGLNLVPVVGGAVASLIGDYIPMSTQRGIEAALQDLQDRLVRLETRIDPGTVNREQFAETFKSSYLVIIRTHDERRRRAAVSGITNLLLREDDPAKLPFTELDHFIRALETLSAGALDVVHEAVAMGRDNRFPKLGATYFRFNFADLQKRLHGMDSYLLLGLVGELNTVNFIHQPTLPNIRDESNLYGNYPLELTPLGVRFVERMMEARDGA